MPNLVKQSVFTLILWRITLTTLVFMGVMAALIYTQFDQTMILLTNRSLEDRAKDIASYLEKSPEQSVFLNMPAAVRQFYANAGKFHQYIVRDPGGNIFMTSPIAFADRYPQATDEPAFEFYGPLGTHYLGISYTTYLDTSPYTVQVAQNAESAEAFSDVLTTNFLSRLALLSVPFVLALVVVIYYSLKQSLKPLSDASREAQSITFQKPDMRLNEAQLPAEIRPLVRAVNRALERLEIGIKGQQEFTANVAHELRTPLTILKARIATLPDLVAARELSSEVDDMIHAVNQMLDLSRLDFPEAIGMDIVYLDDIVKTTCKDMWPLFIRHQKDLNVSGTEVRSAVFGNSDLVQRALRNLMENALRHTPAKTPVDITVGPANIAVRDYGPTIPEGEREKIFRRFHRNDRDGNRDGTGLGLSIVSRTMQIHGGHVVLETPSDEHGNIFRLEFP